MVKIKLRDDVKEFPKGITPADVCKEISMGLYRNLCACLTAVLAIGILEKRSCIMV